MFNFTPYDLRHQPTPQEYILWDHLRARRMLGFKFRRQHPIGPFIADFVCLKEKIIIELDGPIHENRKNYDERRDVWLKSQGYAVIRIKNEELDSDWKAAVRKIHDFLVTRLDF